MQCRRWFIVILLTLVQLLAGVSAIAATAHCDAAALKKRQSVSIVHEGRHDHVGAKCHHHDKQHPSAQPEKTSQHAHACDRCSHGCQCTAVAAAAIETNRLALATFSVMHYSSFESEGHPIFIPSSFFRPPTTV